MKKTNDFLIIGGDRRQLYMADYLESLGFGVEIYGLPENGRKCAVDLSEAVGNSNALILPLPTVKDDKHLYSIVPMKETVDDIASLIRNGQPVFAGMISKAAEAKLASSGGRVYDYFRREEVTVMNTVPTAQGILKTVFENIDYTVHSSKCAVFGYGRVAKTAADVLSKLGASVTVCARKYGAVACAEINGMNGCLISDFYKTANEYDIIINTVPSPVIDRKILENVRSDCLIIDVASAPFGTDFAAAYENGIKAIQCPSLPGKVAPKTAGKIIADGILNIMKEEGQYG